MQPPPFLPLMSHHAAARRRSTTSSRTSSQMPANTGQNRAFTSQQQRTLIQAHELVAIYYARRPENLSTLDSGNNIPHIRRSLALLDPNAIFRSENYDKRSPEALNLRHHSQRASEVRRALELMEPAMDNAGLELGGADTGAGGELECFALVVFCVLAFLLVAWLCNLKVAAREQEQEDRYRQMRYGGWG
ncbi:hypothetical protein IWZ03DRAFT_391167 [Phyllosticta citriasiana]|uniref:Uncharacterized protein n=1 Tax=Phyllosticta citriasiana TaxID=595635 RepID=A0ABR1KCI0_9PEZI